VIQQTIAQINLLVNQMNETGKPDKRVLAIAAEANQRYIEYLDELETTAKPCPAEVVVEVDGETIKFQNIQDVATWLTTQK
jgi:sulfur carrier protein ThiS